MARRIEGISSPRSKMGPYGKVNPISSQKERAFMKTNLSLI
jgi:hypothetical protein